MLPKTNAKYFEHQVSNDYYKQQDIVKYELLTILMQ